MDIPIAMCDHRRVTGVDMVCFIPTINGLQRQLSWCNHGDGCRSFKERGSLYPLVNIQKAIENGHRNSWFTQKKWWFSMVMLVYQRVCQKSSFDQLYNFPAHALLLRLCQASQEMRFSSRPRPHAKCNKGSEETRPTSGGKRGSQALSAHVWPRCKGKHNEPHDTTWVMAVWMYKVGPPKDS